MRGEGEVSGKEQPSDCDANILIFMNYHRIAIKSVGLLRINIYVVKYLKTLISLSTVIPFLLDRCELWLYEVGGMFVVVGVRTNQK